MLSYQHFIPFLQNVNDVLFRQEKKEKKKCTLSSSSFSNIDDENCNDTSTTKSKQLVEMEKISELYDHDLDKYLGIYWERETISKKVATQQPSVDPLPILNTIDLNVLMESDDEPVIETVMINVLKSVNSIHLGSLANFGPKNHVSLKASINSNSFSPFFRCFFSKNHKGNSEYCKPIKYCLK